jgi:hypothetical protein
MVNWEGRGADIERSMAKETSVSNTNSEGLRIAGLPKIGYPRIE